MDIKLFDKRYVYLEWSDELEGKDCILAKTYQDLKDFVNSGDEGRFCKANKGKEKPFTNGWSECDFCYYDPNLKVKKAWLEGKTIQKECGLNEWKDYIDNLSRTSSYFYNINWDAHEWRVKPIEETWYVIFAENNFLRVSLIPNLSNIRFFSGTYEECGKWIDEHKSYARILSAWKDGKIIQYKIKTNDDWSDWVLKEYPTTDSFEIWDWRIKPIEEIINYTNETSREPIYILNMYKKDKGEFEFTMSEHDSFSPIYANTRKKCQHVLNTVVAEFTDKCVGCKGNSCFNCKPLQDFIKNIKFTRRMTNRELAEWLAKGNGEMKNLGYVIGTSTSYCYKNNTENENVNDNILIRDFGSDEWRQPLIEV